jgi:hypothetical protein
MAKRKQTDRATPQISDPYGTPAEAIAAGDKHIAAIKAYKDLKAAPEVEAAVDLWTTENDALRANQKAQADKRAELAQLQDDEAPLMRRWNTRRRGTLGAVAAHSDGSKDVVKGLGFDVAGRARAPEASIPQAIRPKKTRGSRAAAIVWKPTPGAQSYLVQFAPDPANPATYSAETACTAAQFTLSNQTPGTYVHFRVLAIDPRLPNGKTEYSDWVAVLVHE